MTRADLHCEEAQSQCVESPPGISQCSLWSEVQAGEERDPRHNVLSLMHYIRPDFLFRVMSERIAPDEHLDELMNSRVKPALSVIPERVRFRTTSAQVFNALYADFMKPVTHIGAFASRLPVPVWRPG